MAGSYVIIDHTADIGISVSGRTYKELFESAAAGLFGVIADSQNIQPKISLPINISAGDMESLLVRWLNELLYLWDTEHLLFNKFSITSINKRQLKADCGGEKFNSRRHNLHRDVKAATYHMLKVQKDKSGYFVTIILDI